MSRRDYKDRILFDKKYFILVHIVFTFFLVEKSYAISINKVDVFPEQLQDRAYFTSEDSGVFFTNSNGHLNRQCSLRVNDFGEDFFLPVSADSCKVSLTGRTSHDSYAYDSLVIRDTDFDGILDGEDNCPFTPNSGQEDSDSNNIGDACSLSQNLNFIWSSQVSGANPIFPFTIGQEISVIITLKRNDAGLKNNNWTINDFISYRVEGDSGWWLESTIIQSPFNVIFSTNDEGIISQVSPFYGYGGVQSSWRGSFLAHWWVDGLNPIVADMIAEDGGYDCNIICLDVINVDENIRPQNWQIIEARKTEFLGDLSALLRPGEIVSGIVMLQNAAIEEQNFSIITPPAHGQAAINPKLGQWIYLADPGFVGFDPFLVSHTDSSGYVSIRAIDIVVGSDGDNDNSADFIDNCPLIYNPNQKNIDGDKFGDVCDIDIDGDGEQNSNDAFPLDPTEQIDSDADNVGDNSDNCLFFYNPEQLNFDDDVYGDACDEDIDNDGIFNITENKFSGNNYDPNDRELVISNFQNYILETPLDIDNDGVSDEIEIVLSGDNESLTYNELIQFFKSYNLEKNVPLTGFWGAVIFMMIISLINHAVGISKGKNEDF